MGSWGGREGATDPQNNREPQTYFPINPRLPNLLSGIDYLSRKKSHPTSLSKPLSAEEGEERKGRQAWRGRVRECKEGEARGGWLSKWVSSFEDVHKFG